VSSGVGRATACPPNVCCPMDEDAKLVRLPPARAAVVAADAAGRCGARRMSVPGIDPSPERGCGCCSRVAFGAPNSQTCCNSWHGQVDILSRHENIMPTSPRGLGRWYKMRSHRTGPAIDPPDWPVHHGSLRVSACRPACPAWRRPGVSGLERRSQSGRARRATAGRAHGDPPCRPDPGATRCSAPVGSGVRQHRC
jgi:hypothetical protein